MYTDCLFFFCMNFQAALFHFLQTFKRKQENVLQLMAICYCLLSLNFHRSKNISNRRSFSESPEASARRTPTYQTKYKISHSLFAQCQIGNLHMIDKGYFSPFDKRYSISNNDSVRQLSGPNLLNFKFKLDSFNVFI